MTSQPLEITGGGAWIAVIPYHTGRPVKQHHPGLNNLGSRR
jgi:hypothetical protein